MQTIVAHSSSAAADRQLGGDPEKIRSRESWPTRKPNTQVHRHLLIPHPTRSPKPPPFSEQTRRSMWTARECAWSWGTTWATPSGKYRTPPRRCWTATISPRNPRPAARARRWWSNPRTCWGCTVTSRSTGLTFWRATKSRWTERYRT